MFANRVISPFHVILSFISFKSLYRNSVRLSNLRRSFSAKTYVDAYGFKTAIPWNSRIVLF